MAVEGLEPRTAAAVESARALVEGARRIVVLTGAGISTDSGIPDFRGPNGVWTKNPEAEKQSTLQHYLASKEVRRGRWQALLDSPLRTKEPNIGHRALVELERRGKLHTLLTQNVDGLHQKAGSDPGLVVEIHGTVQEVNCLDCGERAPMERALDRVRAGEDDPACRTCGGILKSATISFGQQLVARDLQRADEAARSCDLMFAIGTTLAVYPIADVVPVAKRSGAAVIILNAEETAMDGLADVVVRAGIAETLPTIVGAEA